MLPLVGWEASRAILGEINQRTRVVNYNKETCISEEEKYCCPQLRTFNTLFITFF